MFLQPLDATVINSFKRHCEKYRIHVEIELYDKKTKKGNIKSIDRQLLTNIISKGWNEVPELLIRKSFELTGLHGESSPKFLDHQAKMKEYFLDYIKLKKFKLKNNKILPMDSGKKNISTIHWGGRVRGMRRGITLHCHWIEDFTSEEVSKWIKDIKNHYVAFFGDALKYYVFAHEIGKRTKDIIFKAF